MTYDFYCLTPSCLLLLLQYHNEHNKDQTIDFASLYGDHDDNGRGDSMYANGSTGANSYANGSQQNTSLEYIETSHDAEVENDYGANHNVLNEAELIDSIHVSSGAHASCCAGGSQANKYQFGLRGTLYCADLKDDHHTNHNEQV